MAATALRRLATVVHGSQFFICQCIQDKGLMPVTRSPMMKSVWPTRSCYNRIAHPALASTAACGIFTLVQPHRGALATQPIGEFDVGAGLAETRPKKGGLPGASSSPSTTSDVVMLSSPHNPGSTPQDWLLGRWSSCSSLSRQGAAGFLCGRAVCFRWTRWGTGIGDTSVSALPASRIAGPKSIPHPRGGKEFGRAAASRAPHESRVVPASCLLITAHKRRSHEAALAWGR